MPLTKLLQWSAKKPRPLKSDVIGYKITMPSKVKIISLKELEIIHTGSLMSRRKKLFSCEESLEKSDRHDREKEPIPEKTGYIEFKNSAAWKNAYKELKVALSTREHYRKN